MPVAASAARKRPLFASSGPDTRTSSMAPAASVNRQRSGAAR